MLSYRYVTFRVSPKSTPKLLVYSIDGEYQEGWKEGNTPTMTEYSTKQGAENWEQTFFQPISYEETAQAPGPLYYAAIAVFRRSH